MTGFNKARVYAACRRVNSLTKGDSEDYIKEILKENATVLTQAKTHCPKLFEGVIEAACMAQERITGDVLSTTDGVFPDTYGDIAP